MDQRAPGEGRYARLEREQRWTASAVPDGVERSGEIVDRYITGTRLRLRRMSANDSTVFKLAQKVRVDDARTEQVMLTNIYLSDSEYEVFDSLPAAIVHKTRWRCAWEDRWISVDEFHGRHDGLVLAEVELVPDEELLALPPFARLDVTGDERYSGGALAVASDEELAVLRRSP